MNERMTKEMKKKPEKKRTGKKALGTAKIGRRRLQFKIKWNITNIKLMNIW